MPPASFLLRSTPVVLACLVVLALLMESREMPTSNGEVIEQLEKKLHALEERLAINERLTQSILAQHSNALPLTLQPKQTMKLPQQAVHEHLRPVSESNKDSTNPKLPPPQQPLKLTKPVQTRTSRLSRLLMNPNTT